jgi:hypothetical protein
MGSFKSVSGDSGGKGRDRMNQESNPECNDTGSGKGGGPPRGYQPGRKAADICANVARGVAILEEGLRAIIQIAPQREANSLAGREILECASSLTKRCRRNRAHARRLRGRRPERHARGPLGQMVPAIRCRWVRAGRAAPTPSAMRANANATHSSSAVAHALNGTTESRQARTKVSVWSPLLR